MMDDIDAYRFLVENMTDGVYFVDRNRTVTGWNHGAEVISGFAAEEVVGRRCQDSILNHVNESGRPLCANGCPLEATMRDGKPRKAYIWMNRADGTRLPVRVRATPIRDECGTIVGSMEIFTDDTPALDTQARRYDLELTNMIDPVTGLGNRDYLHVQLTSLCQKWTSHGWPFGILVVTVDELESMGAKYDEDTADRSLRLVADTLTQNLPSTTVIAYCGDYRFAALVLCAKADDLARTAKRVRNMIAMSRFTVGQEQVRMNATIGTAFAADGDNADELLGRAEYSLHRLMETEPPAPASGSAAAEPRLAAAEPRLAAAEPRLEAA